MKHFNPRFFFRTAAIGTLALAAVSPAEQAHGQVIIPFVSGVEVDFGVNGGTINVHFGYVNTEPTEIFLPTDPGSGINFFLPNSDNTNEFRGQPIRFLPGTFRDVFAVSGTAAETIIWQLEPDVQAAGSLETLSTIPVVDGVAYVRAVDDQGIPTIGTYRFTSETDHDPGNGGNDGLGLGAPTLRVEDGGTLLMQSGTLEVDTMVVGDSGLVVATGGDMVIDLTLTVAAGGFMQTLGSGFNTGEVVVEAGGTWTGTALGSGDTYNVGGLLNAGQVNLSGVTIEGEVTNQLGSTTNILGDVVFNDLVSGPGGFFGSGTALFNGGYAPGASPAVVEHENNVVFGSDNTLEIELAGLALGEFDRLEILQNLTIDGLLDVTLIDGFTLGLNQAFVILDVDGTTTGQFTGLGEGALVDTFGGIDLFISYTAGDGNDVSLFTVPEPASLALLALGGLMFARRP